VRPALESRFCIPPFWREFGGIPHAPGLESTPFGGDGCRRVTWGSRSTGLPTRLAHPARCTKHGRCVNHRVLTQLTLALQRFGHRPLENLQDPPLVPLRHDRLQAHHCEGYDVAMLGLFRGQKTVSGTRRPPFSGFNRRPLATAPGLGRVCRGRTASHARGTCLIGQRSFTHAWRGCACRRPARIKCPELEASVVSGLRGGHAARA
jgi:hypothetical protein